MLTPDGLSGIDEVISCGTRRKGTRHTIEARFHFEPATEDVRLFCVEPKTGVENVEEDCQLAQSFGRLEIGRCRIIRVTASLPLRLGWRLEVLGRGAE